MKTGKYIMDSPNKKSAYRGVQTKDHCDNKLFLSRDISTLYRATKLLTYHMIHTLCDITWMLATYLLTYDKLLHNCESKS